MSENIVNKLREDWKIAASTVGLLSIGAFTASQTEPVLTVCSFTLAAAAALYIALDLSTPDPDQDAEKTLRLQGGQAPTFHG